eukprot:jgi/Astpho2/1147/e_gw1.00021.38.1_t
MPPIGTSCRDRTAEFLELVQQLSQQTMVLSNADPAASQPAISGQASEFRRRAALIGKSIQGTSQRLQQLTQLAKRTSMFDDPAQQINELTQLLKQDIQALNAQIADLQQLSQAQREGGKQSADHSSTVVENLRMRLKDTTKEFQDVLTLRTENLKAQTDRRSLFSAPPDKGRASPFLQAMRSFCRCGGISQAQAPPAQGAPAALRWCLMPCRQPLLQQQQAQQQQQLVLAQPQDNYLASRNEALHQVETTIHELGSIFQQLAHMVQEQGEVAIRIDENVDDALANVDSAQTQLLKYLNSISSNRWLIMKIFFVLMIFLVIFVVFVA